MSRIRGGIFIYAGILASIGSAAGAAPLITSKIDDNVTTAITGERSSFLAVAKDRGIVSDNTPMTHAQVLLRRPPALQAAFDKLVNDQLDRKSVSFHHWLSPADLKNYAPDARDVAQVVAWLQGHGLTVNSVSPSAMMIDVSGPASALAGAFHTSLHNVVLPNGEAHIANMTDLAIPAALAPVLRGATLSNFFPQPNYVKKVANYTFGFDHLLQYAVVPADFATIYNLNPLFSGNNLYGAKIAGAGVTIAVVEQTEILRRDWDKFRTTFGLSGYAGKLIFQQPGACDDPGFNGNEAEAAIDAEWSSAVAPDANIIEAACSGGTLGFGVETALQNLVENGTKASVLSISYGGAEAGNSLTFLAGWENLVEEGASEGLSIFVSTGDSGVAFAEEDPNNGIGVNGLSTTPYNTAVGGTDFYDTALGENATYWSTTNSSVLGSAKSYIPEIPWDNSCASSVIATYLGYDDGIKSCNSTPTKTKRLAFEQPDIGGTGGQSIIYTKPGWQSAPGVPNDGVRDQPDVSMFASNGPWDHFYLICMSDKTNGGAPCNYANKKDAIGNAYGGTSISTPAFAGAIALVVQSYGGALQGNAAPRLYQIATAQFSQPLLVTTCNSTLGNNIGSACVFNDVTAGDNAEPCTAGTIDCYTNSEATNGVGAFRSPSFSNSINAFPATAGYDLATGLGSVNITTLLYNY